MKTDKKLRDLLYDIKLTQVCKSEIGEMLSIISKTLKRGKMSSESLGVALNKVSDTINNLEEFKLVCKYFEKITLGGISIEAATKWWLKSMPELMEKINGK